MQRDRERKRQAYGQELKQGVVHARPRDGWAWSHSLRMCSTGSVRILLANKFYSSRGGAESVVLQTHRLLEEAGHEVIPFAMHQPADIATTAGQWDRFFVPTREYFEGPLHRRALDSLSAIYSFEARRKLRALLRAARPDVAHLHNIYHQLTLSIVDELRAARIPIVMTLHDYKPACPNYQLLTHDGVCQRCVGGAYWNAVRHRCLKGSVAGSAIAAAEAYLNRIRHQYRKIDLFLSPSAFLRDVMVRAGLPSERIHVLRNSVPIIDHDGAPHTEGARFVYLGRLSDEKGIDDLLFASARLTTRAEVVLLGRGPSEEKLRARVEREQLPVVFGGFLGGEELKQQILSATAGVLPSRWYENCPMSILEAGALAVPTVASDIGGIPELISSRVDGILVPPGDPKSLGVALVELTERQEWARSLGQAAKRRVLEHHDETAFLDALVTHYEHVLASSRSGKRPQ